MKRKNMPYRKEHREKKGGQRLIQAVLTILILGICFDYGKHVILKKALEGEIEGSQGVVSLGSLTVSPWPLFQSHLIKKGKPPALPE